MYGTENPPYGTGDPSRTRFACRDCPCLGRRPMAGTPYGTQNPPHGSEDLPYALFPCYTHDVMSPLVNQVSKALNIKPSDLIRNGLLSYVEREIRLTEEDIADFREKYLVSSRSALQKKIKSGATPNHPGWEDVIAWENLEDHLTKLRKTLKKLH